MCGIFGIIRRDGQPIDKALAERMAGRLHHRGPDNTGYFLENDILLGNTRLAIIDLEGGNQPIFNADESRLIVFNGEIYNHHELRTELEAKGHRFRTDGDTEVLLHAYEAFGDAFTERVNGMYAAAIFDRGQRRLLLARDRLGIKPIYYADTDDAFIFASESKAILEASGGLREPDWSAIGTYMTLGYFPLSETPYRDIRKFRAGHLATVSPSEPLRARPFWEPRYGGDDIGFDAAVEKVGEAVNKAVEFELQSDVPVGVFLSGGLDSSLVAHHVQKLTGNRIPSFSLGFEEATHDETEDARTIAEHLGLAHHSFKLSMPELAACLEKATDSMDEPFGDPTVVPLVGLSERAAEHVKVILTGWGGDEMFAGYPTCRAHRLARYYKMLPSVLRDGVIPALVAKLPPSDRYMSLEFKLKRFVLGADLEAAKQHLHWMSYLTPDAAVALMSPEIQGRLTRAPLDPVYDMIDRMPETDVVDRAMHVDAITFMEGNGLYQSDRMIMAASVEGRVPLLNNVVLDAAMGIPSDVKMHGGTLKAIVKELLRPHLPERIINLRKKGFAPPGASWLRNVFRERLEDTLSPDRLRGDGFFDAGAVRRMIDDHMNRKADHARTLWMLMSLHIWLDKRINTDT